MATDKELGIANDAFPPDPLSADAAAYPSGTGFGATGAMVAGSENAVDSERLNNDDVVHVLNDLLENSRDGEYGFLACAQEVESSSLKQLFGERAAQCRAASEALVSMISQRGGSPASGGTTMGAVHRGWVHVKGSLGGNSEQSILEECERGEDAALARYRKALKNNLPPDARGLIEQQAQGAQRHHDQIRDLRNEARART